MIDKKLRTDDFSIEVSSSYLLCCDWGTSFFRLQLVALADGRCVGESLSGEGVAYTYEAWQKANGASRFGFFRQKLQTQIEQLAAQLSIDLKGVPVVVSGMASSSIGMEELPYAPTPFALDGRDVVYRQYRAEASFPNNVWLISGVQHTHDVIRGEETQLLGVMNEREELKDHMSEAVFIFPGTHSKHLYVHNNRLVDFSTYMTGELFDLMAHDSILKDSVDVSGLSDRSEAHRQAFGLGVRQALADSLSASLFKIRTNHLLGHFSKPANAFFLSGLLIGVELAVFQTSTENALILCSGSKLAPFYTWAVEELGLSARTRILPADVVDKAAGLGQRLVFKNLKPHPLLA